MEILTTITARDYSNLRQTYSEKNIINQTTGTEYVIDVAEATPITDALGRPMDFNITPLGGGTKAKVWASKKALGPWAVTQVLKGLTSAREEYYRVIETFSIQPDQVIDDINTLSIKLIIDYDKYVAEGQLVNETNFDDADTSVFYSIMTEENKENKDGYLTAEMQMPLEHSRYIGGTTNNLSANFPLSYIWPSIGKAENGNFQLTLKHETTTYWGYNVIKGVTSGATYSARHTNTLFVARALHFKLSANTVTERSLDFNYTRTLSDNQPTIGKTYEMGTNEFLQTEELADVETRQSYQLSQEIFNKFDTDRPLISFLLLNCEKYLVDGTYRYLRAEDLIYIKDENDEYIGTETTEDGDLVAGVFEVIKTRPIWAGSYQMEVTCRQIDMTE